MKKVQDPLKFSWLIACKPSDPWQPGILLCQYWQQIQGTASPASAGSLLGTKHEAAFLPSAWGCALFVVNASFARQV